MNQNGKTNNNIYINDWNALSIEIQKISPSSIFVLVDENTEKHCLYYLLDKIEATFKVIRIKSGEVNKNIDTCQHIWESLIRHGADRKSLLINLGGGVIGDMGGFCAAVFMRGIRFIQMPTTLLSQVDSSVGGKMGIDFLQYKNMIGLFGNPSGTFIFTQFLRTLPERELKSGFAEIIKYGLIADKNVWQKLTGFTISNTEDYTQWVSLSVEIKQRITSQDFNESGLRKILNFGHTVGHAIESYWMNDDKALMHGEAVAIGMIAEAFISYRTGYISEEELFEIRRKIIQYFGHHPRYVKPTEALIALMQSDKKNESGTFRFTLLKEKGQAIFDIPVPVTYIEESLIFYATVLK